MLRLLVVMTVAAFMAVGCGKSSNNGSDTTTATTSLPYSVSTNGQCYNQAGQVVDTYYCQNVTNAYSVNGYCYNNAGARIDASYCTNNYRPLYLQPRQCEGQYYAPYQGKRREVRCFDRSCRGSLVFDRDGRAINCR